MRTNKSSLPGLSYFCSSKCCLHSPGSQLATCYWYELALLATSSLPVPLAIGATNFPKPRCYLCFHCLVHSQMFISPLLYTCCTSVVIFDNFKANLLTVLLFILTQPISWYIHPWLSRVYFPVVVRICYWIGGIYCGTFDLPTQYNVYAVYGAYHPPMHTLW